MNTRTRLLAIAIALLASASPSFAQDVQSRPHDATPCAAAECERDGVERPSGRTVPAEVLSIDESSGRVVLNTEIGVVTVAATPAIVAQLSVGDVVMLRLIRDGDDAPAASPPTEDNTGPARRF